MFCEVIGEDVGDDLHRVLRRIDVGVAHHELFQNVVLNGAGQLLCRDALLFRRHDVQRHDRQDSPVHGHRDRHLVERNAIEQRAHVVDGIDGDARHAHITGHARMIAVVAAVGGKIEGNRKPFLAGRQVAPVEGIRIFRRRETGILADGPGLGDIHGRVGPAQEGGRPWPCVQEVEAFNIGQAVSLFDIDAFRRAPALATGRASCHGCGLEPDTAEIRKLAHDPASTLFTPILCCSCSSKDTTF
jgi:hypothetical protein